MRREDIDLLLQLLDERGETVQRRLETLITLVRACSGEIDERARPVDAGEMIREAARRASRFDRARHISVRTPPEPVVTYVDPARATDLIHDILAGAADAAPDRTVRVSLVAIPATHGSQGLTLIRMAHRPPEGAPSSTEPSWEELLAEALRGRLRAFSGARIAGAVLVLPGPRVGQQREAVRPSLELDDP